MLELFKILFLKNILKKLIKNIKSEKDTQKYPRIIESKNSINNSTILL